jgi:hypothetical protein
MFGCSVRKGTEPMKLDLTRRHFLWGMSAATLWSATEPWQPAAAIDVPDTDNSIEDRAHAALDAYDAQGVHRTATDVDRASGDWLRGEAERAGGVARLEGFPVDRLDVREAFVEIEGRRITGLPFFDGGFTDAAGIMAAIGSTGIHLVTADRTAVGTEGGFIKDARQSGQARAIIVITDSDVPGLVPSNASRFEDPYGCPVIQVASDARAALEEVRQSGATVRVVCQTARTKVTAFNVVAEVPGHDVALPPVVVITPRSGWWQCAAERGGGIVCWLETMRALAAAMPARRALFVASSGHELGHLGLDAFLHANEPLVRGAHTWIHLGANIGAGARQTPPAGVRLQASHDALDQQMTTTLTAANAPIADHLPRGGVPVGEARNLHTGGARYVSVLGLDNRWFHHPDDRYPRTVTAALVTRYARGVADAALALARS